MQISKITIENFRSIKFAEVIPNDLNIFVGQNNHGKTNFFEAIDWFFSGTKKGESIEEIRFGRTGDAKVEVLIEFEGAQDGASRMKNEGNKTKMLGVLDSSDTILVKRSSDDPKKRSIFVKGAWVDKLPTGFDTAFNDFLPRFEYIDTRKYFEDVAKFSKTTPVGIMLSGVLTTILEKSTQYQEFHKNFEEIFGGEKSDVKLELDNLSNRVKVYLERQFPDCTKVTFEVAPPVFDDLLKNFDTSINDGIETSASEKGDGMQRGLMLAILQAYADFRRENEDIGKSFLFFIDEAELHLHPSAQRKLKEVLIELADEDDQVFINTHSSVLVVDEHPNQQIFKIEKSDRQSSIVPIGTEQKPYVIYELLGGSPADLLLPKNFLVVEGHTELELLTRLLFRLYPSKPKIQVISAGGDLTQVGRSLNAIEQIFKPLDKSIYRETVVIYVDKHDAAQVTSFLGNYPHLATNGQFIEATAGAIEESYPPSWRQTPAQVKVMGGPAKITLAQQAGDSMSLAEFEAEMPKLKEALEKVWALAYL